MACRLTCLVAAVFLISMVYTTSLTGKHHALKEYKDQLTPELEQRYEKITEERRNIFYKGYFLGFALSIAIIFMNKMRGTPLSNWSIVCTVLAVSFLTNYFFYILHPKSDWMLNHIDNQEQSKAWLKIYRSMQVYHHGGLALGLVAVGIFAYAFRC